MIKNKQTIRDRALHAIGANRVPGLHFPGHFLNIRWSELSDDRAHLELDDGPHCRNATGAIDLTALAILIDMALGTAARLQIRPGARLGTVYLQVQFTGVAAKGDVTADAHFLGFSVGTMLQRSLATTTLRAKDQVVCHASGEFVPLDPPAGAILAPLPWQLPRAGPIAPPNESVLTPHECATLRLCEDAISSATPSVSFVQKLWGGAKAPTAVGAGRRIRVGPHLGNRVGHVQGGILLSIAASTACDAAPATMALSSIAAWFVSPGRGKSLVARSRISHLGRSTAVVRTQIKTSDRQLVLEAVTQHIGRAGRKTSTASY